LNIVSAAIQVFDCWMAAAIAVGKCQLYLYSQVTFGNGCVVGAVVGMNLRTCIEKCSVMTQHYNCMLLDDLQSGNAGYMVYFHRDKMAN